MARLLSSCLLSIGLLTVSAESATALPSEESQPNFVIILADDMGWGDAGCYGAPHSPTPALDEMAAEGLRMTQAYATPICSPSRACLFSGQYAWRSGFTRVLFPEDDEGVSARTPMLPEVLHARGYSSVLIGKWHLGHQPRFLPTRRGFNDFFGLPYSNDMRRPTIPLPLMRDLEVIEENPDLRLLTQRYTEEATASIREHADVPFLLVLAHAMPHLPLASSAEFDGRTGRGKYADAIAELDWSTGRILQTLREEGLATRTLVLFTSDNGPRENTGNAGRTGGLRGWKKSSYEGGVRVPFVAWWPGRIRAGQVSDDPVGLIDVMPTFASLAGAALTEPATTDGMDCSRWWLGADEHGPRREFEYWSGNSLAALRVGDWKRWLPGTEAGEAGALYDLQNDPGELHDLLDREPARAAEMLVRARSIEQAMRATHPAMTLPAVRPIALAEAPRSSAHHAPASGN